MCPVCDVDFETLTGSSVSPGGWDCSEQVCVPARGLATLVPVFLFPLIPSPHFWQEEWGLVPIWGPGIVRQGPVSRASLGAAPAFPLGGGAGNCAAHWQHTSHPGRWGSPPGCPLSLGPSMSRHGGGRGQRATVCAVSHREEDAYLSWIEHSAHHSTQTVCPLQNMLGRRQWDCKVLTLSSHQLFILATLITEYFSILVSIPSFKNFC